MKIKAHHKRRWFVVGRAASTLLSVTDDKISANITGIVMADSHRDGHRDLLGNGGQYLTFSPKASDNLRLAVKRLFTNLYEQLPDIAIVVLSNNNASRTLTVHLVYGTPIADTSNVKPEAALALEEFKRVLIHGR